MRERMAFHFTIGLCLSLVTFSGCELIGGTEIDDTELMVTPPPVAATPVPETSTPDGSSSTETTPEDDGSTPIPSETPTSPEEASPTPPPTPAAEGDDDSGDGDDDSGDGDDDSGDGDDDQETEAATPTPSDSGSTEPTSPPPAEDDGGDVPPAGEEAEDVTPTPEPIDDGGPNVGTPNPSDPLEDPDEGTPPPTGGATDEVTPPPAPVDDTPEPLDDEPTPSPIDDTPAPAESPNPDPETIPGDEEQPIDADGDGVTTIAGDCNDQDATVYPGADEVRYDDIDQDCNGSDLVDGDGDGYAGGDAGNDCNDWNASIHPGATEACDSIDNNCDGQVDEGVIKSFYQDADGDGDGNPDAVKKSCNSSVSGYVTRSGDCDDEMWSVNGDGYEVCNGLDDDCDGLVDSADTFDISSGGLATFGSSCASFDRLSTVEIPDLSLSYEFRGFADTYALSDGLFIGGHTPGATPPSSWPQDCTFFDQGYYWYDLGDAAAIYPMQACFSKGTDANGNDEIYLQVSYAGFTMQGVLNSENDSDAAEYDAVYEDPEESDESLETWYASDTVTVSGTGYSATIGLLDGRGVLTLTP